MWHTTNLLTSSLRTLAKIFETFSHDINECHTTFNLPLLTDIIRKQKINFLIRYFASENFLCEVFAWNAESEIKALRQCAWIITVNWLSRHVLKNVDTVLWQSYCSLYLFIFLSLISFLVSYYSYVAVLLCLYGEIKFYTVYMTDCNNVQHLVGTSSSAASCWKKNKKKNFHSLCSGLGSTCDYQLEQ